MARKSKSKLVHPVDWSAEPYGYSGGRIAEIPLPHVRYFPHPAGHKRVVHARITTFRDFCVGASHWYLSLEMDSNPVWDGSEDPYSPGRGAWKSLHDDPEELSRHRIYDDRLPEEGGTPSMRFDTRARAVRQAEVVFARMCDPGIHHLVFEDVDDDEAPAEYRKRYGLERDGD